jgi:hypothetical protein
MYFPTEIYCAYSAFKIGAKTENFSFGPPFDILMKIWQNFEKIKILITIILLKFWDLVKKFTIKSVEFTPPPEF